MKHLFYRLIKALAIFMLIAAIIHIALMLVHAILTGDFSGFNFFSVIELTLFFPNAGTGTLSYALSTVLSLAILMVIFISLKKK